jgi:hypothetical protein
VRDKEGHHHRGTLLDGEWAGPGGEGADVGAAVKARSARGPTTMLIGKSSPRHPSKWGRRCGTAGLGWYASSPVLLPPRWRSGSGGDEGAVVGALKRSQHGGSGGSEGVPAAVAWEGNENWGVIQAERRVLNLYSKILVAVLYGTAVEACISTAVHRKSRC